VLRLPCSVRPAAAAAVSAVRASLARRASPNRRMRAIRLARRAVAGALAASAALALAACDGGAIGQDTPASNGQSFVSGSYGTMFLRAGQRPAEPPVAGTTLTGLRLSLASYRGRVLVLNFWGSWCPPCRQEAPALGTLARQFRSRDVQFLGVDIQDNVSGAEAFARTFRITYPSLNDPSDEIALAFRGTVPPAGIPTTLLIDRNGRIAARIVGGASYAGLKSLITRVDAKE
jgi:thiol-disulfide isomerase/thioredoxin